MRLDSDPLEVGDVSFALRQAPTRAEQEDVPPPVEFARPVTARQLHPPLRLRPSAQSFAGMVRVAETVRLGPRLVLVGDPDLQAVGEAFHRFFACDDPARAVHSRMALAGDMLRRWGASQVASGDLMEAADRLHAFVDQRYGGSSRLREWPVYAIHKLQVISGRIDLLIDDGDCFAVIDHKSFPGAMDLDEERLRSFAGQVDLYARALRAGTGRECRDHWIHQPIAGLMIRVELKAAEAA